MAHVDWEKDEHGAFHEPKNVTGERQLRAQVRDFIAYLQAHKVL